MPYIKEVFDVQTFDQAKHVVLTSDPDNPKKFEIETNFLSDTITKQNIISSESIVLDFGCGMGRMSKSLIDKFDCKVIGLDISDSMLTFARLYTANVRKFIATKSYPEPSSVDVCLAVLVLQHTEDPKKEIENIFNVLKPNGYLIVVNENKRFVPSDVDAQNYVVWNDDGFDIFDELKNKFNVVESVQYMNKESNVMFYKKPG